MWLPRSADEVRRALASGGIEETATFDGKQGQPKSPDLVVDVGAMTVAGGVLLFGVAENEERTRIVGEDPIELTGQRERVQGMITTGLSEPPHVVISALPLPEDNARGFLAVHVPQSGRAPHQIVLKGKYEGRFYARDATGNRILTQQEIELLYERRRRWERNLEHEIRERAETYRPSRELDGETVMTMIVEPVSPPGAILQARSGDDPAQQLLGAVLSAIQATPRWRRDMAYFDALTAWSLSHADAWHAECSLPSGGVVLVAEASRGGRLDVSTNTVGSVDSDGRRIVSTYYVAGVCTRTIALAGQIVARAGFMGICDVCLYLGPLRGTYVHVKDRYGGPGMNGPYGARDYIRSTRVPAAALFDAPTDVARELLSDFLEATNGTGGDPFVGDA